jgi:hypothetical protein
MPEVEKCENHNCSLPPHGDDVWHVKKVGHGKQVISWLNGHWKTPDGQTGTYTYIDSSPWWERALNQLHANDEADDQAPL